MTQKKLIVLNGDKAGLEVPIAGPKFMIGRAEDCRLRPNSEMISRHHCAILLEDGAAVVRDFGSKNGTFVNDQQVQNQQELKTGDRLRVGPLEFEVRLPAGAPADQPQADAAQTAPDDAELDISDWIGEGAPAGDPGAETHIGRLDFEPEAQPEEAEQKPGEQKGKKKSGKLTGRPAEGKKPIAESSRSAASEALNKLFYRR